jgi:hypothetical protein
MRSGKIVSLSAPPFCKTNKAGIKEVLGIKNSTEITDIKIATEKLFLKEK